MKDNIKQQSFMSVDSIRLCRQSVIGALLLQNTCHITGALLCLPCSLLFSKSRLEKVVLGTDAALHTCKQMLTLWKKVCEPLLNKSVAAAR